MNRCMSSIVSLAIPFPFCIELYTQMTVGIERVWLAKALLWIIPIIASVINYSEWGLTEGS